MTADNEGKTLEVMANIRHPERGFLFYVTNNNKEITESVLVEEDEAIKMAKLILKAACVDDFDDDDDLWS